MDAARIVELLAPFLESPGDCDRARRLAASISTYIDVLLRWNARINLTGIREPEQIITRHFGESFFAARYLFPSTSSKAALIKLSTVRAVKFKNLADLGSGAGFPGIPIKLWTPNLAVTLIESHQKKSVFLREVARILTLTDIDIQNVRAQTLPQAAFDVVTLRAVERFEQVLPVASALVTPGGRLALLVGHSQLSHAKPLLPDYVFADPLPIPQSNHRVLVLAHKP